MHIVYGIIGVVLSILLLLFRYNVKRFIGEIQWAEEHLGSGGTYTLLLLVSLFGFFLSLTILFDGFSFVFGSLISRFFPGN